VSEGIRLQMFRFFGDGWVRPWVCDGARVQVWTTGPGQKRDSENGVRKTRFEKNGIRPSSRSGPARQKLDHLFLCSALQL
jgi:hypothetical protein